MIFKLVMLIFFLQQLNAAQVVVKEDKKLPEALKQRVTHYWSSKGDKEFEKSYSYELPYLQYLHTEHWYEKFFQNAPKFSKIELKKITKKNNTTFILGLLLYPKFAPNSPTYLYDKWINIDGIWYHKYIDSAIPITH